MTYVKIKPTTSIRNGKNHHEGVTELEVITFVALGEVVRNDIFQKYQNGSFILGYHSEIMLEESWCLSEGKNGLGSYLYTLFIF